MIVVYTDGACIGNPGPGGWAALILENQKLRHLSGSEAYTTNNRMEMIAAIRVLEELSSLQEPIELYTDSIYLQQGITKWIQGWKKKGWLKSNKEAVKNEDLWKQLDNLNSTLQIDWKWIRGHSGDYYNEMVDQLAQGEARKKPLASAR